MVRTFEIDTNHGLCVCSAFLLTKSTCQMITTVVTKTWHYKSITIFKCVNVTLLLALFILRWIYLQEWILPHAWLVVIITRRVGLVVAILSPSKQKSPYRSGGLMTFAALPPSQRTAWKASWTRKIFPWKNPRARSLLRLGLPGLGPTCKTMEWTLSSMSTIQI